jgi:hypothetical protein
MKNRYDRILAKIDSRLERVKKRIIDQTEGTEPFDTHIPTKQEKIADYIALKHSTTPEMENELYNQFGQEYTNYKNNMENLIGGNNG